MQNKKHVIPVIAASFARVLKALQIKLSIPHNADELLLSTAPLFQVIDAHLIYNNRTKLLL